MKTLAIALMGLVLAGCSGGAPSMATIATVPTPAVVQAPTATPGLPSAQALIDSGSTIPAGIYACPKITSGSIVRGAGNVPYDTLTNAAAWHLGPLPANSHVVFSCPNGLAIDHLVEAEITGVTVDCAFMGDCVTLTSAALSKLNITIQNVGHGTALTFKTRDALNSFGNQVQQLHIFGADRGIYLQGAWPGELSSTTWNRFGYVTLYDVGTGIDFGGAADTNTFDQVHISALRAGGRAVVFNSADPLHRVVADDNVFHQLMVDVADSYRGPIVQINASQGNVIENLQLGGAITDILETHGNPSYTLRTATIFSNLERSNTDTIKALQLLGGDQAIACNEITRGTIYPVRSAAGDVLQACVWTGSAYAWRQL
jgi:hypothetical protein